MREFSNHAVLSISDSTMAFSSKYTQDLYNNLSVQIVFFTFSCKWFLCFYFWATIWSYIVDLFAALHEVASASARTLLKLASSVRALLKPYGDTLRCLFIAALLPVNLQIYVWLERGTVECSVLPKKFKIIDPRLQARGLNPDVHSL